jgi:hypothetical protein
MIDHRDLPERREPAGAIGALIRCACGHGIGAHTRAGCHAGSDVPCACHISDAAVLERAIAQAALELQAAMPPTA